MKRAPTSLSRRSAVQVMDSAFWLYRERFALLFGASLMATLPGLLVVEVGGDAWRPSLPDGAWGQVAYIAVEFALWCLTTAASASAIIHVADRMLCGTPTGPRDALEASRRCYGRSLVACLLTLLTFTSATGLVAASMASLGASWLTAGREVVMGIAGFTLTAVAATAGIAVCLPLALMLPVIVTERAGLRLALARSWWLGRGQRRRLFAMTWLYLLLATVLTVGIAALAELVPGDEGSRMLKAVLERVAPALTHPLLYASLTIIHREARIDCEALDVRLAALDEKRGAHPDESASLPRR